MKLLILFLLMLSVMISINEKAMATEIPSQEDAAIKQIIEKHVKQTLLIDIDKIEIVKLDTLLSSLPKRYRYYQAEKKNGGFFGSISFYIVANGKLYSSAVDEDFSKFLKQERFLETKNFTANQFVALYDLMCIGLSKYSHLVNPPEHLDQSLKHFEVLFDDDKDKLPTMKEVADGVEIVFWTKDTLSNIWQKSTVRVTKDYKVTRQIEEKSSEN